MNGPAAIWLEFIGCGLVIGVAGAQLVRYGDALAAATGLSRGWVGMILMAVVTSLPELVTGLSAVTVASAPNMAIGDALGSTVFNLALLALAELIWRRDGLYVGVGPAAVLSAGAALAMLGLVTLALMLGQQGSALAIGHVSPFSILLVAVYGISMRAVYRAEQRSARAMPQAQGAMSLRRALTGYGSAAVCIVLAGIWLPIAGVELARVMGWSDSFVGTLLIALATSMPELVTTVASLRIGAVDLALGNLLGSNLFDLLIVALDDLAYRGGPIYQHLSAGHTVTALLAAAMTLVVVAALRRPPRARLLGPLSWVGVLLALLYLLHVVVQARQGS